MGWSCRACHSGMFRTDARSAALDAQGESFAAIGTAGWNLREPVWARRDRAGLVSQSTRVRALGGQRRWRAAIGEYHRHLSDEIVHEHGETIILVLRERYSMSTFCPSTNPASLRPRRKPSTKSVWVASPMVRNPNIGAAARCCARAASGYPAAKPAIASMKSHRRIASPKAQGPGIVTQFGALEAAKK